MVVAPASIRFDQTRRSRCAGNGLWVIVQRGKISSKGEAMPPRRLHACVLLFTLHVSFPTVLGRTEAIAAAYPPADAGDFYHYDGRRIPLHRSLNEISIRLNPAITAERRQDLLDIVNEATGQEREGRERSRAPLVMGQAEIRIWRPSPEYR
jgi:hypothetical protein